MLKLVLLACVGSIFAASADAQAQQNTVFALTPSDVTPGSITSEDVPDPHTASYLSLTPYGQNVRRAFMDVAPVGQPSGHTVVQLHGNNFGGGYFGGRFDVLCREGFRVVVPDRIGYGRSSKPIIPYNFHGMARHLRLLPQSLEVDTAMIVGHSMGAMAAARFATPYLDSMISDWEHVQAPTLLFGGTEDSLPGSAAVFQQRMQIVAERIPNG